MPQIDIKKKCNKDISPVALAQTDKHIYKYIYIYIYLYMKWKKKKKNSKAHVSNMTT